MTTTPANVNGLIDHALTSWKEPDPHVIARRIALKLTEEQLREVAVRMLPELITERIRGARNHRAFRPSEKNATTSTSRWAVARDRIQVPGEGWKFEHECTAEDLHKVADWYAAQAGALMQRERHYRGLAEELERAGVETLADLNLERRAA